MTLTKRELLELIEPADDEAEINIAVDFRKDSAENVSIDSEDGSITIGN